MKYFVWSVISTGMELVVSMILECHNFRKNRHTKHSLKLESSYLSIVKHARLLKNYEISCIVSDIGTGTEQV